jgi:hypothetical protein
MGKEHFDAGSSEGKGYSGYEGILDPIKETAPQAKGTGRVLRVADSESGAEAGQGGGIVEDTPSTRTAPVGPPKAAVPFSEGGAAQGGQHPGQTLKTKDIHSALTNIHGQLDTVARNASSLKRLHPDHQNAVIAARQHLNDAGIHLGTAAENGIGVKNITSEQQAATKLGFKNSISSIMKAHKALTSDGLQAKLAQHNLGGEIPDISHLKALKEHVSSMRGKGAGGKEGESKSYKYVALGKTQIPTAKISEDDLARAEAEGGKGHIGVQKLRAAIAGTPKGGGELVSGENYEAARDAGQVRSSKSGMTSGTQVDPRKFASAARTVRTRISNGSNVGKTPTFGESGASGTRTGDFQKPEKRSEGRGKK